MTAVRIIPHIKIGRLVFFDPDEVRSALAATCMVKTRSHSAHAVEDLKGLK